MSKPWVVIEQNEGYVVEEITDSGDVDVFFVDYSECLDPDAGVPYATEKKQEITALPIDADTKTRIVKILDGYIARGA